MAIHLRQICLVADRLHPAVEDLGEVFTIPVCHVDPAVGKFGLENTLLSVGSQFLEVVAPTRENTAAGRFLDRRGGNGGYMVICQAETLQEQADAKDRAMANNVRVAFESDHGTWNIMQLHPADMGASFFEIDWDEEADVMGNWQPAGGKGWREIPSTEVITGIVAVELQSQEPEAMAERWAAVAGQPVTYPDGVPTVGLANANLRFVPVRDGRGDGLGGLDIRVRDRARLLAQAEARGVRVSDEQLSICGTRFYPVD